jgi:hypothetical protein
LGDNDARLYLQKNTSHRGSSNKVSTVEANEIWQELFDTDIPSLNVKKVTPPKTYSKPSKSDDIKRYMSDVASLGCIVCRTVLLKKEPATLHHIREGQGMSTKASDKHVIPLCPLHHQYGTESQHGASYIGFHQNPRLFRDTFGDEWSLFAKVEDLLRKLPESRYF